MRPSLGSRSTSEEGLEVEVGAVLKRSDVKGELQVLVLWLHVLSEEVKDTEDLKTILDESVR